MSHRPAFSSQPNNMAQARRTQGAGWSETSAKPGPSGPEGEREATQILPAGRDFLPKGPHLKRRFGSLAAVGNGTRRRGGGTPFLCSFQRWKEPKIAGVCLRGAPALQSPTPGPRYGGRFPGDGTATPARAVQTIAPASAPLPLAGIFQESRASWKKKARRLPPAVGAGSNSAGGWGHPPLRKEVRTTGKRTRARCKQPWRLMHFRPGKNSKVSAYCGHYGPPFTCYSGKRKRGRRGEGAKI